MGDGRGEEVAQGRGVVLPVLQLPGGQQGEQALGDGRADPLDADVVGALRAGGREGAQEGADPCVVQPAGVAVESGDGVRDDGWHGVPPGGWNGRCPNHRAPPPHGAPPRPPGVDPRAPRLPVVETRPFGSPVEPRSGGAWATTTRAGSTARCGTTPGRGMGHGARNTTTRWPGACASEMPPAPFRTALHHLGPRHARKNRDRVDLSGAGAC